VLRGPQVEGAPFLAIGRRPGEDEDRLPPGVEVEAPHAPATQIERGDGRMEGTQISGRPRRVEEAPAGLRPTTRARPERSGARAPRKSSSRRGYHVSPSRLRGGPGWASSPVRSSPRAALKSAACSRRPAASPASRSRAMRWRSARSFPPLVSECDVRR